MGYGGSLTVTNHRLTAVHLYLTNIGCMVGSIYDPGSWQPVFDGAEVAPSTSLPSSGGQYIEADASGDCWDEASTFALHVYENPGPGNDIGVAAFQELGNAWSQTYEETAGVAHVTIQNSHPQAILTVDIVEG